MGTSCTEEMGYPDTDDETNDKHPVDQVYHVLDESKAQEVAGSD